MQIESMKNDAKVLKAWAFFDWANSAYSLVITTAIFPIYYIAIAPEDFNLLGIDFNSSALYSFSIGFAYILIAMIAPLLGGMADAGNRRLQFLKWFTTLGGVSCILLFFFNSPVMIWMGTIAFIISTIGFAGSLIFYDAFLPVIATRDRFDKLSATGYAYGYVGSVILLVFILFMSQSPSTFGIAEESSLPYRIGFVLVGLWWMGFAQYSFRNLPKDNKTKIDHALIKSGYREIRMVAGMLNQKSNLKRFLISFFFYSAGVQTVIYLATVFAQKELNFESSELIMTVLILQVVAIFGAFLFARYSKASGSKKAIVVMITIWIGICLGAYFVQSKMMFFLLSFFVGLVLGGLQSSSRASYAKLIEKEGDYNSYFSFYDLLYYLSIVFGTFAFGLVDNLTNNLRYSVLFLALFFVIALFFFRKVKISA